MDMHFARILMAATGVQPGSKVFSLVEFFQSPCTDFGFALTQKVMLVTFVPITKENHEDPVAVSVRRPGPAHDTGLGACPGSPRHAAGGLSR
jgi:hypothetical protein